MPFIDRRGVGSAWGMPVVADGSRRLSALALSEGLAGGDGPLSRAELAALGIGELGRYPGGEVIKPLALGAGELLGGALSPGRTGAAALFVRSVELEKPPPGPDEDGLLHAQLEWLRGYGLSGGVLWPPERAGALAAYIRFLRETCGGKCLVFMDRAFFEGVLRRQLSEAAPFAAREEGIPVNWELGGAAVFSAGRGLGIVLYEDAPPAEKIKTDIALLIDSRSPREPAPPLPEVRAGLKLGVIAGNVPRQESRARNREGALLINERLAQSFLFRSGFFSLCRETPLLWRAAGGEAPPVPSARGAASRMFLTADFRGYIGSAEAERLGIARQAGEGRVKTAARGIFAVTAKFSGLTPADFRDEQNCWYETGKGAAASGGAGVFAEFDRAGRAAFFRWRDDCRGGRYRSASRFAGTAEASYLRVYVRELVLGMGREGRMETFQKLRELYQEFGAGNSSAAFSPRAFLLRTIVDFMIIYDLEKEALPLLAAEGDGVFDAEDEADSVSRGQIQIRALGDLIRCRLFVEQAWERPAAFAARFAMIASLIPRRILERSGQRPEFAGHFCAALDEIDRQLRTRWDKSFFEFFFPPALSKSEVTAFADIPNAGHSSYTLFWPAFSTHRPLIETLGALARDTGANPLSGGRLGRPISLEAELIESLRGESDAVRDLLSVDAAHTAKSARPRGGIKNKTQAKQLAPPPYHKPDRSAIDDFMRGLDGEQRGIVIRLLDGNGARESGLAMGVDSVNAAFEARFGDLLVDTGASGSENRYSISAEYRTILTAWKSPGA
ncbi:MAG: hypothetical protein LBN92_04010 [Treponema sp.]|jgi:hypothetical protein|nr:hypothetical protein [Treponema sp.]